MRIYLISNMYPDQDNPQYGVFVKNFREKMEDGSFHFVRGTLLKGKKKGLMKLGHYLLFILDGIVKLNLGKFDLVYVHYVQHSLIPLHFWLFNRNKKVVLNAHGTDLSLKSASYSKLRSWNFRIFSRADLVVIPSDVFVQKAINAGAVRDKIHIYPSGGIDPDVFYPDPPKKNLSLKIGFIGRLDKGKGCEHLIEAFSLLPKHMNLMLILVGMGNQEDHLRSLVQKFSLKEKVVFLGPQPQNKLRAIYASMDVFIFPTLLEESLGLVGLESMACGTPVVGSDIGALPTYIKEGVNGFLVKPGSAKEIADKIIKFYLLDDLKKEAIRLSAINTASRYFSEQVNKELKRRLLEI